MRWEVATRGLVRTASWVVCAAVLTAWVSSARAEPPSGGEAAPVMVVRPQPDVEQVAAPAASRTAVVVVSNIMPLAPLDFEWQLSVKVVDLSYLLPLPEPAAEPQGISLGETPTFERGNPPH